LLEPTLFLFPPLGAGRPPTQHTCNPTPAQGSLTRHEDNSFGGRRIEICCSNCGGHMGG